MTKYEEAVAQIREQYAKQKQEEFEMYKSTRQAWEEMHTVALRMLKESKKSAMEEAAKTYQQPTPVEKKRTQIAYRLQAAIKALVQEWGGRDVYDYAGAACKFEVLEQNTPEDPSIHPVAMRFTIDLPYKEPAE